MPYNVLYHNKKAFLKTSVILIQLGVSFMNKSERITIFQMKENLFFMGFLILMMNNVLDVFHLMKMNWILFLDAKNFKHKFIALKQNKNTYKSYYPSIFWQQLNNCNIRINLINITECLVSGVKKWRKRLVCMHFPNEIKKLHNF